MSGILILINIMAGISIHQLNAEAYKTATATDKINPRSNIFLTPCLSISQPAGAEKN